MYREVVQAYCEAELFFCSLKSSASSRLMAKWHGFWSVHTKGQTVPGRCVGTQGWGWLGKLLPHPGDLCPSSFMQGKACSCSLKSENAVVLTGPLWLQIHLIGPLAQEKSTQTACLACVKPPRLLYALIEEPCVSSRNCSVRSWAWGCCHLQTSEANAAPEVQITELKWGEKKKADCRILHHIILCLLYARLFTKGSGMGSVTITDK